MNVTIFGTGYVGLVTGACFAEMGNRVLCVDVDEDRIAMLNEGRMPIYEPGLPALVATNRAAGRLTFGGDGKAGLLEADVAFLAVGTPARRDGSDGSRPRVRGCRVHRRTHGPSHRRGHQIHCSGGYR